MHKKMLLGTALAAALFAVAACGDSDDGGDTPTEEETATEQQQLPEPDVEDVPDVVATVNGNDIPKDEFVSIYEGQFQQMAQQAQMTGQEVDQDQLKQQTVDGMVDTELLTQEADERGFSVSEKDINDTLADLAEQNGMGSADEFMGALKEQGMEEPEVKSRVEIQVKIEQLIADEAGDIQPSDKELKELYDTQKEQMGETAPPFAEMKPQLEEQAKAQKESEVAQTLVGDLRENADISVNL